MSTLEPRRPGALALVAFAALAASPGAFAADECRARYGYQLSGSALQTETVDIDKGAAVDIDPLKGNKVKYVSNMRNNSIRVYRTGFGEYIDLAANGRDPIAGNYVGNVTLQKIRCLEDSTSASAPTIQQLVNAAFQAVTQATVAGLNTVNGMISSVNGWAQKTASDWGSCPSPGAQDAYNQAKSYRSQIDAMLAQVQQIKANADAARANCLATTNNAPLCNSTYNGLPLHGWITTLTTAKASVNAAMQSMAALQCPSGCAQTASLPVPHPAIRPGGTHSVRVPGKVNLPVCTSLDLGSIGFNPTAVASGNLPQIVQAKAPSCTSTTNIPVCTDWDLDALLAELKRLKLVPPNISKISLDIPTTKITVVTGAAPARCQKSLQVCEPSGSLTISVNEGKDLFGGASSCAKYVTVGCQSPPFGLQPTSAQVDVPDLAHAKVTWSKEAMGSITVDLSAPQYAKLCRGNASNLSIPKPPIVNLETRNVPLPFICTQPTFTKVVANP